jgi:hypothetical protein
VAYLGDKQPGEFPTARYDVQVNGAADPQEYGFDSTLRYRDAHGNSREPDTKKVNIQILSARTCTVAGLPIGAVVAGIILVVIGIVLLAYQRRKRQQ